MRMPVGNIMTPLLGQTGGSGDRVVAGPNADCRNMPLLRYMCTGGMHADCICILPCRYIISDTCNKYIYYMCNIKIHFFYNVATTVFCLHVPLCRSDRR